MADLKLIKPLGVQNIINKFCFTIGMIPSSYKLSLTYEEQILSIGKYLEETVIPALNNNAEAVAELQTLFVQLKDYVENYFEDLDVQLEINQKLDEMAQDGTLQEIIAQYLNVKAILSFNTVNEMKLANNLINGSIAKTLGYSSINDKGSATYKIRNVTNQDEVNEETLIALQNQNLVAELIFDNCLVPEQIGCIGDGQTDCSVKFLNAMKIASKNKLPLQLVSQYKIDTLIEFTSGVLVIQGSKAQIPTLIDERNIANSNLIFGENGVIETNGVANITFENVSMSGSGKGIGNCIILKSFKNKIINCSFNSFDNAIKTEQGTNWAGENQIVNCNFTSINKCIILNAGSDGDINGCLAPSNCNYFITGGSDAGYKIENNHDYSKYGSEFSGYSLNFVGNYVDGWNKLTINGNSGFNIIGNIFLGNIENEDATDKYAIKFTSANISSGNINGNIMTSNDNSKQYDNLHFIDVSAVSNFNVSVSGNNCRIAKKLFLGGTETKLFYTQINQSVKGLLALVTSHATIEQSSELINGNNIICYSKFNLSGLVQSEVARLSNICSRWVHIVKMNNSNETYVYIDGRSIKAQGDWANATSMEVISLGIRDFGSTAPDLY